MEETPEGKVFLTVHVPPTRLVITGAVHISQALAPIASLLGYDVTIVDPRTAFASVERFPDVKVLAEWPEKALPPLDGKALSRKHHPVEPHRSHREGHDGRYLEAEPPRRRFHGRE